MKALLWLPAALLGAGILAQTTAPLPGHQPVAGIVGAKITNGTNSAAVTNSSPGAAYGLVVRVAGTVQTSGGVVGLTDAELRASPVEVDGTVAVSGVGGTVAVSGPLTDAQLRAVAVPVSGTFWQATQPVSGTVTVTDGSGALNVIVDSGAVTATVSDGSGPLTMDGTVTANLAAGTNNIGDVDVLTLPNVTIGTFPDNEPFNVAQINGVAPSMGNGASGTGVQRVTIANDSTGILAGVTTVTTVTNTNQATAANLNAEVQGDTANAATATGNPVRVGAYVEADALQLDSTNQAEGDTSNLKSDVEGRLLVRADHPNRFVCTVSSTATASTSLTGCAAPGAGLSRYITDIYFANSAATATNPNTIQTGTGTNCGTGTTVIFRCLAAASTTCGGSFVTPIKEAANVNTCFLSATAGTKTIQVMGYIAP